MALAGGTLMCGPLPPLAGENKSSMVNTTKTFLPLQAKKEEGQQLKDQKIIAVSRRDMMTCLTAQTLIAVTFWSTEPAEARISKADIKRKILEKLQQLREKFGILKPKNDSNGKNPSPQSSSGKDEKLKTSSPPNPNTKESEVETVVESAFNQVMTFIS